MAQIGNQNAKKGTEYRNAVRKALKQYEDNDTKRGEALFRIAWKLVGDALSDDAMTRREARKEIGDRTDGRPVQAISGPEGEPITAIERVVVMPVSDSKILDAIDGEVVKPEINAPQEPIQRDIED